MERRIFLKKNLRPILVGTAVIMTTSFFAIGCATPARRPVTDTDRLLKSQTRMGDLKGYRPDGYDVNRDNLNLYGLKRDDVVDRDGMGRYGLNTEDLSRTGPQMPRRYDRRLTTNLGNNNASIERDVENMTGIRDAVVVLDRDKDTCYVGIEPDGNRSAYDLNEIQTQVANRIKEQNPDIKKVYCTQEKNNVDKLRGYQTKIMDGNILRNMRNRIEDLF